MPQLKPCFLLFQRVRDQLYLTPPSLEEHTSSLAVYLGALGFTKPLEKLVLHAVPLKSLLEWLLKPRGPNLLEATTAVVPEKAQVLAATKHMLYGEDPPCVGVGLVYKPHYVSTESFSAAYMHLHVWHAAGSCEDLPEKLDSTHFILVTASEMSDVIPVAMPHPVFPDAGSKEAMDKTGELLAPLWFWGFRLHTVWSQLPGGSLFIRSPFLISEGMPLHPCWSMSRRRFSRACGRGLGCR